MAIVAVPVWTPVPPFPQLSERRLGTYNSKAYAFANHISSVFMAELGALVTSAYDNAMWAQDRAAAAQAQAVIATAQADLAMGYRNTANNAASTATTKRDEAVNAASTATTKRDEAVNAAAAAVPAAAEATQARADALAAAAAAQVFATQQLKATSASNLVPGAGPKTFMVEPGRSFVKGMYLVATSTGAAVNQMSGPVDSYDGATGALALLVDAFTGTAARADWVIGVAASASTGLQSLHRGAYLREANGGTLVTNKRYGIWTGGGAIAMNMPALADCAGGDEILLGNLDGTWAATNFTINCPANVRFINSANGDESTLVCNTNKVQGIRLLCTFKDASRARWAVMF